MIPFQKINFKVWLFDLQNGRMVYLLQKLFYHVGWCMSEKFKDHND